MRTDHDGGISRNADVVALLLLQELLGRTIGNESLPGALGNGASYTSSVVWGDASSASSFSRHSPLISGVLAPAAWLKRH
jgi:hypothetical protein